MAIYKSKDGSFHDDMGGSALHLLPSDCELLSEKEFTKIKQVNKDNEKLIKISEIESTITQRRLREAAIGIDNGWLKSKDAEIAKLRESL